MVLFAFIDIVYRQGLSLTAVEMSEKQLQSWVSNCSMYLLVMRGGNSGLFFNWLLIKTTLIWGWGW